MSGDKITVLNPPVKWAQHKDGLYVTICLSDVTNKVLDLKEGSLHFKGDSHSSAYEVNLQFYAEVDPENSRQMSTAREIVMYIKKKTPEFWPRFLSDSRKPHWLSVDFNHYQDENDSEPEFGMNNDFSSMLSQMSNFNDFGGDDGDIDSDDEDLPDLEPPTKTKDLSGDQNGDMADDEEETEKPTAAVTQEA